MKRSYMIKAIGCSGLIAAVCFSPGRVFAESAMHSVAKPDRVADLRQGMRQLWEEHIVLTRKAKGGNKTQLSAAQQKWSANGKEIAVFLSAANPNWPRRVSDGIIKQFPEKFGMTATAQKGAQ